MSKETRINNRIKRVCKEAAEELANDGTKYFFGALNHETGKAFVNSDVSGDDMVVIINLAFPEIKDLKNLATYVAQAILSRETLNNTENEQPSKD